MTETNRPLLILGALGALAVALLLAQFVLPKFAAIAAALQQ